MADLDIAGLVAQLKGRDVLVVEAHGGKAQSHTLSSTPIKLKPGASDFQSVCKGAGVAGSP